MSIPDATETRICDAVKAFLLADGDFVALCGDRIRLGSAAAFPAQIQPRQMNIYAGAMVKTPDVGGDRWDLDCVVNIEYFTPLSEVGREEAWRNSLNEAKEIVNRLYVGHATRSPGRLLDPTGDGVSDMVTLGIRRASISEPGMREDLGAILRVITIQFITQESAAGVR